MIGVYKIDEEDVARWTKDHAHVRIMLVAVDSEGNHSYGIRIKTDTDSEMGYLNWNIHTGEFDTWRVVLV